MEVATIGHYINEDLVERGYLETAGGYLAACEAVRSQFSAREQEFIRHVCDEFEPTYEQIAERMGVSVSTVQGYRHNIFTKHRLKSKAGLVILAYKWKLI